MLSVAKLVTECSTRVVCGAVESIRLARALGSARGSSRGPRSVGWALWVLSRMNILIPCAYSTKRGRVVCERWCVFFLVFAKEN